MASRKQKSKRGFKPRAPRIQRPVNVSHVPLNQQQPESSDDEIIWFSQEEYDNERAFFTRDGVLTMPTATGDPERDDALKDRFFKFCTIRPRSDFGKPAKISLQDRSSGDIVQLVIDDTEPGVCETFFNHIKSPGSVSNKEPPRKGTAAAAATEEADIPVHFDVACDVSGMNPITGNRYRKKREDYDLCEAEFLKLSPKEQKLFECIPRPGDPCINIKDLQFVSAGDPECDLKRLTYAEYTTEKAFFTNSEGEFGVHPEMRTGDKETDMALLARFMTIVLARPLSASELEGSSIIDGMNEISKFAKLSPQEQQQLEQRRTMKAAAAPKAVAAPKAAAPVVFNLTGHALTATGLEFLQAKAIELMATMRKN